MERIILFINYFLVGIAQQLWYESTIKVLQWWEILNIQKLSKQSLANNRTHCYAAPSSWNRLLRFQSWAPGYQLRYSVSCIQLSFNIWICWNEFRFDRRLLIDWLLRWLLLYKMQYQETQKANKAIIRLSSKSL